MLDGTCHRVFSLRLFRDVVSCLVLRPRFWLSILVSGHPFVRCPFFPFELVFIRRVSAPATVAWGVVGGVRRAPPSFVRSEDTLLMPAVVAFSNCHAFFSAASAAWASSMTFANVSSDSARRRR